jgi:hypothetical protein
VFGFFTSKQLDAKKVAKIAALASNPYAQPEVRMKELQRLMDDGSPVAVAGALKRFGAHANGAIADEEEKKWLEKALVEAGHKSQAPLEHYIQTESKLTYALRAYTALVGLSQAASFFVRVLHAYGPEDHRSVESKLQLIWALEEGLSEPGVVHGLVPFLADHSDDVRWAVLTLVDKALHGAGCSADTVQSVLRTAKEVFLDPSTSMRIHQAYGSFLVEHKAVFASSAETLPEASKGLFVISPKGVLLKR